MAVVSKKFSGTATLCLEGLEEWLHRIFPGIHLRIDPKENSNTRESKDALVQKSTEFDKGCAVLTLTRSISEKPVRPSSTGEPPTQIWYL